MVHQSGPDIVAEHSCFDGQRVPASERAALEATVYLYVASPDGKNDISGSGTVLRDSRMPQGHNRILTIRHVTQHALRKHGRIYILDRFGHKLGEARQTPATILSESQLAQEPDSGVHDLPGDNAVLLDMQPRTPAYDQISGVDVAPRLYRGIMYAWFTDPGALMPGVSGAALLNEHNQVIGIAEGTGGGENTIGSAIFFHGSIAAFMPVAGPGVQEILHLQPTFAPPENRVHVHVFGYPEELYIAYHGQIQTSDPGPMQEMARIMHDLSGL
ncbi:hypothetical protein [Komagataeibacter xylinus]|uniref:hypothetical protein n=1 Tax=Komagataeibacter xylinus TaxID=28448 RepID=UPI0010315B39|nr:hypothetical protein [Komagataeibacter xylinus]